MSPHSTYYFENTWTPSPYTCISDICGPPCTWSTIVEIQRSQGLGSGVILKWLAGLDSLQARVCMRGPNTTWQASDLARNENYILRKLCIYNVLPYSTTSNTAWLSSQHVCACRRVNSPFHHVMTWHHVTMLCNTNIVGFGLLFLITSGQKSHSPHLVPFGYAKLHL